MSKMAIVGCDASGKTVLISALSDHYKAGSRPGQSCIMVPADTVTRRYTDNLHRIMRINGEWPEATSDIVGGSTLTWMLVCKGRPLANLELMDFGGENFRYAFRDDGEQPNPQVVERLKEYISSADFVVITVSMDKMLRNLTPSVYRELERGDIEYDRDSEAQWVTTGLLKMVSAKLQANPPGVVVALTQADKHRKELQELGGAKGVFEKCWPTIAMLYPSIPVVAVASIDRMTSNGLPADGYSTDGVLPVMKEFARYSFGDSDELSRRLDTLRAKIGEIDEKENAREFVEAVAAYRRDFETLRDKTAVIEELFVDRLKEYEGVLSDCKDREAAARRLVEEKEREEKALQLEKCRADAERIRQEAERARQQAESTQEEPSVDDAPDEAPPSRSRAFRIVAALAVMAGAGACGWLWLGNGKVVLQDRPPKGSAASAVPERKQLPAPDEKAIQLERERRAQELALEKAKVEQERMRLELEKARAEKEKAQAEAQKQESARKAQESEVAARRADADKAQAQLKIREAELERSRQENQKAQAEKERAEAERDRLQTEMRRQETVRKAAQKAEQEKQAVEAEKARIAKSASPAGLVAELTDCVNQAKLERGRALIAELAGMELTDAQQERLKYARLFMDRLEKAQNGNGDDMVWIGNQYYSALTSLGVVKNTAEAHAWYQKAVVAKVPQAFYFLSLLTEQGEGCKKDEALSGRYCLQAARMGVPEAMYWTGVYFKDGTHGFEQSSATAYKYLTMARSAGVRNGSLERMIEVVESAKSKDTIDACYPEDPMKPPVKVERKDANKDGWFGGLF